MHGVKKKNTHINNCPKNKKKSVLKFQKFALVHVFVTPRNLESWRAHVGAKNSRKF